MPRIINSPIFRILLLLLPVVVLQLICLVGNFINYANIDYVQVRSMRYISTSSDNTISTDKKSNSTFPPLVLIFEGGCSGSTAVGRFIEEIITAHGLQRFDKVGFEFMDTRGKKYKNPFYHEMLNESRYQDYTRDEMLIQSVARAKKEADSVNQLFYFKAHIPKAQNETLKGMLDEIGVTFVGVYRENVLDRCICTTKDCFPSGGGYPVFKHNGTRADICFDRRRQADALPTVAYFENPIKCLRTSLEQQNKIKRMDFPSVSEENLFEFEYTNDNDAYRRSIDCWVKILTPFLGKTLDRMILREVLDRYRNTRSLPSPHHELIYNFEHLMQVTHNTKWATYLRQ